MTTSLNKYIPPFLILKISITLCKQYYIPVPYVLPKFNSGINEMQKNLDCSLAVVKIPIWDERFFYKFLFQLVIFIRSAGR